MLRYAVFIILAGLLLLPGESWGRSDSSGTDAEKIDKLKAAAPLNHSVRITRIGRLLKLDYELIGSDGKKYNIRDISRDISPKVSVYNSDNFLVHSGNFSFG